MTALDAVPVGRITARARDARPGRAAASVIAGVLFAIGWLAFKALSGAWFAVVWAAMAVAEGWSSAAGQRVARGPARAG